MKKWACPQVARPHALPGLALSATGPTITGPSPREKRHADKGRQASRIDGSSGDPEIMTPRPGSRHGRSPACDEALIWRPPQEQAHDKTIRDSDSASTG
jgi:hypothetical protein